MSSEMAAVLVVGLLTGVWYGRTWAERARARFDQQQTWRNRKNYHGTWWPISPGTFFVVTALLLGALLAAPE